MKYSCVWLLHIWHFFYRKNVSANYLFYRKNVSVEQLHGRINIWLKNYFPDIIFLVILTKCIRRFSVNVNVRRSIVLGRKLVTYFQPKHKLVRTKNKISSVERVQNTDSESWFARTRHPHSWFRSISCIFLKSSFKEQVIIFHSYPCLGHQDPYLVMQTS